MPIGSVDYFTGEMCCQRLICHHGLDPFAAHAICTVPHGGWIAVWRSPLLSASTSRQGRSKQCPAIVAALLELL
jgi:hypothetical protein